MYSENLATERGGTDIVVAYLEFRGAVVHKITDPTEQQTLGDLWVQTSRSVTPVELKIERKFTNNLFVETWSNREHSKPGWLHTSKATYITFYFIDCDQLYGMSFPHLRHWLLNQHNATLDRYREVRVKGSFPNDTYGRPVPIAHLRDANLDGWWEATPKKALGQHAFIKTL